MATMANQTAEAGKTEAAEQALVRRGGQLDSDRGVTTIADSVVAKVVGLATREVAGVHDLGGAPARALSSVASRVGVGSDDRSTRGVSVEVGRKEAAADLTVVVEYGESIPRVTTDVRENVIRRVEGLTGLRVTEVNVAVNDLHFAGEDETPGSSRVE
jgi:uncharacterized alkaline shock family protein YloU